MTRRMPETHLDLQLVHLLAQCRVLCPQCIELLLSRLCQELQVGASLFALLGRCDSANRYWLSFWCLGCAGIGRRVSRAIGHWLCRRSSRRIAPRIGAQLDALPVELHLLLVQALLCSLQVSQVPVAGVAQVVYLCSQLRRVRAQFARLVGQRAYLRALTS